MFPEPFLPPLLSDAFIYAMCTDTGRVRRANQDASAISPELGAFVVCDGMGGAAGGEVASQMAASVFLEQLRRPAPSTMRPRTRLQAAILAANQALHRRSVELPNLRGMGTTMVALLYVPPPVRDRRSAPRTATSLRVPAPPDLYLANVGDSRCYRLRAGSLHQLSVDHSFVEEQLRAGQITAEEAACSPMRNYITRAVGPHTQLEPDLQSYQTRSGDVYLLCSDGLTRELDDETLARLLRAELGDGDRTESALHTACGTLIRAANDHGGRDNITVLLVAMR